MKRMRIAVLAILALSLAYPASGDDQDTNTMASNQDSTTSFSADGKKEVKNQAAGSVENAKSVATSLANRLLESGAREILEEIRKQINE